VHTDDIFLLFSFAHYYCDRLYNNLSILNMRQCNGIMNSQDSHSTGKIRFSWVDDETMLVHLIGTWKIGLDLPSTEEILTHLFTSPNPRLIIFEYSELVSWDSSLLSLLINIQKHCGLIGIHMQITGLPRGVQRLLRLASKFRETESLTEDRERKGFLSYIGESTYNYFRFFIKVLEFIGESSIALIKFFTGKARYRGRDMSILFYECGMQALPIVSLISVLVGLILAFVGVVQLKMFGAQIYIADLVGIAMVREMGAMMTAIIMMGRTGAAFATQLGTMEVNEEIDALKTLGISPMEFLVMPRILALFLMMPLLCVYSDIVGILGGAFVGVGIFDLSAAQYFEQTRAALSLTNFSIGIIKSAFFAVIIAISGCLYGMECGRSASSVGDAATKSVVMGIVFIIIADGIFAVITNALWI